MPEAEYKRCSKCGEIKPRDRFQRNRNAEDGLQHWCKDCIGVVNKAYRERNREHIREITKRWTEENPERRERTRREWRETNPERLRELRRHQAKRNRERHPEKHAARCAVTKAISVGKLTRSDHCERCGALDRPARDGRPQIHGHHADYSKPLDVEWLCRACHKIADAEVATQPTLQ
jgi:hypothetical protein